MTKSEKLARRLDLELGMWKIAVRPANRGHHREDSIVKWTGELPNGAPVESYDTMTTCVSQRYALFAKPDPDDAALTVVYAEKRQLSQKGTTK